MHTYQFIAVCAVALATATVVAQPVALEQDARVVEVLQKNGSDFSKPHQVDYFYVLPSESSAKELAAELGSMGPTVKKISKLPDGKGWEIYAQQSQLVNIEIMQNTTTTFAKLAKKFGGYYDGWGAPVAK
jgi:regulator of RNase E activity RraB